MRVARQDPESYLCPEILSGFHPEKGSFFALLCQSSVSFVRRTDLRLRNPLISLPGQKIPPFRIEN